MQPASSRLARTRHVDLVSAHRGCYDLPRVPGGAHARARRRHPRCLVRGRRATVFVRVPLDRPHIGQGLHPNGACAMNSPRRAAQVAPTLDECRIRATMLLKDLRADDPHRVRRACERLYRRADLADLEPMAIRRKHALATVAAELGFASWSDLKRRLEVPPAERLDSDRFFDRGGGPLLNRWFARYDKARASLDEAGGYLFPFRWQFFVCEATFLADRGLDPDDPDWERIGRDWVRPADLAARERLERRLVQHGFGGS